MKTSSLAQGFCWRSWLLFSALGSTTGSHLLWGIRGSCLSYQPHPCLGAVGAASRGARAVLAQPDGYFLQAFDSAKCSCLHQPRKNALIPRTFTKWTFLVCLLFLLPSNWQQWLLQPFQLFSFIFISWMIVAKYSCFRQKVITKIIPFPLVPPQTTHTSTQSWQMVFFFGFVSFFLPNSSQSLECCFTSHISAKK